MTTTTVSDESAETSHIGKIVGAASALMQRTAARISNRYRPELHYMRGPGPKWRERWGDEAFQMRIKRQTSC